MSSRRFALPPNHQIRAVVFDFDGTAIPNQLDGMPSARLVQAIADHRHHLRFIGATGRPLSSAIPVIEKLGLTDPVVTAGGTIIYDPVSRSIISRQTIPLIAMEQILELFRPLPQAMGWDTPTGFIEQPAADIVPRPDIDIIFTVLPGTPKTHRVINQLNQIDGIIVTTAPAWEGRGRLVLNITPEAGTKEHALRETLARIKVPQAAVIGVGDAHNDLHLFRAVGFKVAMGNAVEELKAAADAITAPVDKDGLAQVIEACGGLLAAQNSLSASSTV